MPGAPTSIVVGGGINAGSPFALDQFLFVTNTTPPEASSSPRLISRATSIEILGDGSLSTSIGNNADANGPEAICIGRDCTSSSTNNPSDVICIGQNMKNTGNVSEVILIGHDVSTAGTGTIIIGSTTSATINTAIIIGFSTSFSGTMNGVLIGASAISGGGGSVVIGCGGAFGGTSSVVVGHNAGANGSSSNCIILGNAAQANGTSTGNLIIGTSSLTSNVSNILFIGHNLRTDNGTYASGDVVIGHNNVGGLGFSSRVIWFGDTHTSGTAVPASAMRWKNAAGTNVAAGDLTVTGPRSTGNATPASVVFQVGITGSSGTTLQTATTVATLIGSACPCLRYLNSAGTIVTPTFGAAVTIDNTLGDIQRVVANAATAPTIGAPSQNGVDGQYLTVIIRNASGGAMGATTWNAAYHLAGAWTNPANGTERTIKFRGNGAGVWYEEYRNTADVTT